MTNYRSCTLALGVAIALLTLMSATRAAAPGGGALITEDLMIPALDPGIQLHLRNKRGAGQKQFTSRNVVLFVHGATFPSVSAFDVDLPGGSWMSHVAERGFDVYGLDIRGYGGSTRPPSMDQPPENGAPFADTREAVRDIAAAVDFILGRRGVSQLSIVGWSWGTTTVAGFTVEHPSKVNRLVLFAPVWLPVEPPPFKGAYRTSNHERARAFTSLGLPPGRLEDIMPSAVFDQWWAATQATDPGGARLAAPVVRSPNGVLKDFLEQWSAGKPTYDPARVTAPALLIVGEWDLVTPPAMALELFKKLTGSGQRRVVILSEGTHSFALEKNRMHLIREVQGFLEMPLD